MVWFGTRITLGILHVQVDFNLEDKVQRITALHIRYVRYSIEVKKVLTTCKSHEETRTANEKFFAADPKVSEYVNAEDSACHE